MGSGGTKEGNRFVKGLIKHEEIPWYLLLLPNGKWAAFWSQGMDSDYSEAIFNGDYDCPAFVGNKKDTIEFILKSLREECRRDPNFKRDVDRIGKSLFRSNSKLNKFPD